MDNTTITILMMNNVLMDDNSGSGVIPDSVIIGLMVVGVLTFIIILVDIYRTLNGKSKPLESGFLFSC